MLQAERSGPPAPPALVAAAASDPAGADAFVRTRSDGAPFHRAAWRDAVARAFGHRDRSLLARRGGAVEGLLPLIELKSRLFGHAFVATAFAVGGGVLAADAGAAGPLLAEAVRAAEQAGAGYVELRDVAEVPEGWVARGDLYAGFARDMAAEEEECLRQIPRKQRAVVRKAIERGMAVTVDRDVETFFRLYARTVHDHGTPVFPKRWFAALLDGFGADADILTVREGGRAVASVLSLYHGDRVLPYYTGSLPEARDLGANDYMYWRLMRHAVARGARVFDFGRSKVDTGPYSFKKNWGFSPRPITHAFRLVRARALPNLNPTNPKFQLMIKVWQRLPLPVANLISPFVSRNLG